MANWLDKKKQFSVFLRFLFVFAFSALYAWGGMEFKWLRRYLAPTVLCGGIYWFSKDWKAFLSLPLLFGSLSLGYGADETWLKIIKRAVYGFANGTASSVRWFFNKQFLLAGFQCVLLISAYVCFGVWNPLGDARAEEFLLGCLIALIPMMAAKEKSRQ